MILIFFFSQNLVSDEIFVSAEIDRNSRNDPKYAEIFFFFFTAGVLDASEPRRRVSEKRKKKRTLARHRNPASRTRSGVRHRHDAKNGVSVQPRLSLRKVLMQLSFLSFQRKEMLLM